MIFLLILCLSLLNKPTITIIDDSFIFQWANLQNQWGIKVCVCDEEGALLFEMTWVFDFSCIWFF
jgi:hypothetical protein